MGVCTQVQIRGEKSYTYATRGARFVIGEQCDARRAWVGADGACRDFVYDNYEAEAGSYLD